MESKVLAEPFLAGRERELEELLSYLELAIKGKGTTIFVSGEAGSGKTRLASEFLIAARKKGLGVMTGWCLSDAQVPFFPFMEAFNSYYRVPEKETPASSPQPKVQPSTDAAHVWMRDEDWEITSWLAGPKPIEKPGKIEVLSPQAWKDQVFTVASKTLHAIAAKAPLVLFIEDLHWADSASLALLHYISRAVNNAERILVLATYRSEELTSDIEGHPHPLDETQRAMRREGLFAEIKLSSLSQASVTKIAESVLGGSLQQELAEKLTFESKGNPLFVVESLRMLHERKGLIQENNEWRLAVDELGIPSKIKDIILQRLACLKYPQRRVLDAASVIGEEFAVDLISTVLGQDSLDILETLNVIAHSTSIVIDAGNCYKFDHARSRETLYEELSPSLKRGYHARIAEKLESNKSATLPLSDLAYHYSQAGNNEKAVKYALAAGKDELTKWSNTEAIKHFSYVIAAVGEDPQRVEEKEIALGGLADALFADSLYKEAERTFEQLVSTTQKSVVKLRALRMAIFSAFSLGERSKLAELLKKAEQYASSDRLENAKLLLLKVRLLTAQHNWSASIECNEAALQVFEEEYSLGDVAICLLSGSQRVAEGELDGLAESLRAVALFEELRSFSQQMIALYLAGGSFGNCLLWNEALSMYAEIVEIYERTKLGNYSALAHGYAFSSQVFECLGDFEKALSYSLKALDISNKTDTLVTQGQAFSNLTVQYARLGDMKRAEEYFDKLMKLPPEIRSHHFVHVPIAKAAFFTAKAQWKEANQCFTEFLESLKTSRGNYFRKFRTKSLYAWTLQKQGRFEDAKLQIEEVQKMQHDAEERFEHADLQAHLMVCNHVVANEEFEMRLDLVNVGRKSSLLVKVENLLPDNFKVTSLPPWCSIQNTGVEMKGKKVDPFQVETIKIKLKIEKAGTFSLKAEVFYADDLGKNKTIRLNPVTINVEPSKPVYETLPGRVTTGTAELDELLLGGIPEKYAVVLVVPSSDERQQLTRHFVEAGPRKGETTIYLTCETNYAEELAQTVQTNFFIVVCNSQADSAIPNLPNVIKLKGIDSLTEINIALTKLLRTINLSQSNQKRICVDLLSDVLLQHRAITTRKWLNEVIVTLKSKGFTTMAVLDPLILPEEVPAITGLFDGEINVTHDESGKERRKILRIVRLHNQRYSKNVLVLTKESLP